MIPRCSCFAPCPHFWEIALKPLLIALIAAAMTLLANATAAQETKVAIGISGWTGFGPLTLAKEAGIYKKHGLDVSLPLLELVQLICEEPFR